MRINKAQQIGLADLFEKISTGLVVALFFIVFISDKISWMKIILICLISFLFMIASVYLRGPDKENNDH